MRRQIVLVLVVAAAFGLLVPAYKGYGFLDRRIIIAYACLAAVFAVPAVTDAFSEAPRAPLAAMIRVWLVSWFYAALILALGLAVINVPARGPGPLLPRTSFLVASQCLGLTSSALVVAAAAFVTRSWSAATTIRTFRTLFLVLIIGFFLVDRYVPASMTTTALTRTLFIMSAVCGGLALVVAARYPSSDGGADARPPDAAASDLRN